jgi:TrmH family RNA methyltransferase
MKNMGFTQLRLVSPEVPLDGTTIRARAIHAADVYDKAGHYESLAEALADCALVVGTSRRRGKKRKEFSLSPEDLAVVLKNRQAGPVALVFGNERTGLSEDEMDLCNLAAHIPANEEFPSLNLSHAVQVFTYTLSRAFSVKTDAHWIPATAERLDSVVEAVADSLQSIGFYTQAGRPEQERFFRDILAKATITTEEARYFESIFRKAARLSGSRTVAITEKRDHT